MGISIHYNGKLDSFDLLESFCDEIEDISKDMGWEYNILGNDLYKPNTSVLANGTIEGHIPIKGISINIHPKSESLSFYFDKNGTLKNLLSMALINEMEIDDSLCSIKTQFAPIAIHIIVDKLLKYIKSKYISDLKVTDEGEYWDNENQELLQNKFDFVNDKIDELVDALENISADPNETTESLLLKIEKLLKGRMK